MAGRSEIIFVQLLGIFIAGILFASQFPSLPLQQGAGGLAIVLFLYLLVLNIGYRKFKAYRYKHYWSPLLFLLVFVAAIYTSLQQVQLMQKLHFSRHQATWLKVLVDQEPQIKSGHQRFKAKVIAAYHQNKSLQVMGKVLVTVPLNNKRYSPINYGEVLMVPANYTAVAAPQNPGEFDYRNWLATQQVYHQLYLPAAKVYRLQQHAGQPLLAYAIAFRKKQVAFFKKTLHKPEAFALASTLILGYRSDLSKETLATYSQTGTIHALSVSGMHVGIIYLVLQALLQWMDAKRGLKIAKSLLIICLIWYYALLTGLSPSVLRSAGMLSVYILGKTLNRRDNSYNTMAFTALMLLLYQPLLLFDLGFQLSFLSVFGLIYLQPLIYQLFELNSRWADQLWKYTALSLAAQLATFPISVYHFHQFPLLFLFSNLFIVLPVSFIMYIGLAMLLGQFAFLAPCLEYAINLMNAGLSWIAAWPQATLSAIWLQPQELILLLISVFCSTQVLATRKKQYIFLAASAVLCLQASLSYRQLQARTQTKNIVFHIRHHYALAYIRGKQAWLYTDLSPAHSAFQYSIKPALELHHVTSIEIKNAPPDVRKIKHL
jgi:competence protein ComEC